MSTTENSPVSLVVSLVFVLLQSLLTGCGGSNEPVVVPSMEQAEAYEQEGKLSEAVAEVGKLYRLNPADPFVGAKLKQLYVAQIERAEADKDWRQALGVTKDAVKDFPQDGWLRLKRGVFERKTGNARTALEHFRRAGQLGEDLRDVAVETAIALLALERYQQAWDALNTLVISRSEWETPSGDLVEILLYKAKAAAGSDRHKDAVALFNQLLNIADEGIARTRSTKGEVSRPWQGWHWFAVQAYVGLLGVAQKAGDLDLAQEHLAAALLIAPGSAQLAQAEGKLALARGDTDGALQAFEKSLEGSPGNVLVRLEMAYVHISQGNEAAAKAQLKIIRKSHPRHIGTNRLEAELLVRKGDCQSAGEPLANALERVPLHERTNLLMAQCKLKAGQFEQALEYSRNAFNAADLRLDALAIHARALVAVGSRDRAWRLLRDRAESDPAVYFIAALTALQMNAADEARGFLERAREEAAPDYRRRAAKALAALEEGNSTQAVEILDEPMRGRVL